MLFSKLFFILILSTLTNGRRIKRLVGGVRPTEQAKTAVAIMINKSFVCSGTVLSDDYILSAAHCVSNDKNLSGIQVVAGEMDLRAYIQGQSTTAVASGVKQVKIHPQYNRIPGKLSDNNLALLELENSLNITRNANIEKAFLPPPGLQYSGKIITVGGWGKTGPYSGGSPNLLTIEIPIHDEQHCLDLWNTTDYITSRMMCAGGPGQSTCAGDSGAGGIYQESEQGNPVILGVVFAGKSDCNSSTLFTKIEHYTPWIGQETQLTGTADNDTTDLAFVLTITGVVAFVVIIVVLAIVFGLRKRSISRAHIVQVANNIPLSPTPPVKRKEDCLYETDDDYYSVLE